MSSLSFPTLNPQPPLPEFMAFHRDVWWKTRLNTADLHLCGSSIHQIRPFRSRESDDKNDTERKFCSKTREKQWFNLTVKVRAQRK